MLKFRLVALALLVVCARPVAAEAEEMREEELKADSARGIAEKPALLIQTGHLGGISSLAVRPDGKVLATGSEDGTVKLWDIDSGKLIHTLGGNSRSEVKSLDGNSLSGVKAVAFSPDGKLLASGSGDGKLNLWDVQSGKNLQTFGDRGKEVNAVAFRLDGRALVSASRKALRVWDTDTGRVLRTLEGHEGGIGFAAISRDGTMMAIGDQDTPVRIWDIHSAKLLCTLPTVESIKSGKLVRLWTRGANPVAFSSDSKTLATAGFTAKLWDVGTGKALRTLKEEEDSSSKVSVTFSPDNRILATGCDDGTVKLWEVGTGKEIRSLKGHTGAVRSVAFLPSGKKLVSGSSEVRRQESPIRIWDVGTGKTLHALPGRPPYVTSMALNFEKKILATGREDSTVNTWKVGTGITFNYLKGHTDLVNFVALSPNGKVLASASYDKTVKLWDVRTGKELHTLKGHENKVYSVAFSPDGRTLASSSVDQTIRLWDVGTRKLLRTLRGHTGTVDPICFSPDGKTLASGSYDSSIKLWDVASGEESRTLKGHTGNLYAVAFSPDGKTLASGSSDWTVRLWDVRTGGMLDILKGHSSWVWLVAFSPDGKLLASGSGDKTVKLWDVRNGKLLQALKGHSSDVTAVAFNGDGKILFSAGKDGTIKLWSLTEKAARELCTLVTFPHGTWAVVDPEGRYDAANGGDIDGLHWVIGNEPIALSQLKARYYDPGLLAKKLGFNKEPLRRVDAFIDPKLYPELQLIEPTQARPRLGINLTNRGGGIGRVVVLINGKELTADARGPKADANATKLRLEVNLANDSRLVPGRENVIEVHAYNAEGYMRSRGLRRIYTPLGETDSAPPELWLVVAGVSDYRGDALDLRYAAKDASDFAQAARIAGERLFGAGKAHLRLLAATQEGTEHQPSRANLVAALREAQKAKPGDVLVVYLAGHGVNHGGQDGDFYFLCCDAADANLTDSEVRKQVAISSRELTEFLKLNPAQKQVLVLDTCASGRLIDKLTEKRDVPSSQVRALELVKDRTGMYILAGCASDAVSYEATRFAQGVLTYSLLLGMRGAALKEDRVEVGRLFEFAADKVPELARDIGGIQKPVIASPRGGQPFPIGRLTAEDQVRIPLQAERPLVLRCSLQDEVKVRDHLGLSKRVNERLRQASTAGRSAKLVFIEAEDFPDAYELAGRYRVSGDAVTVTLSLFRGEAEIARINVDGSKTDLDALAVKIVRAAEQRLEDMQRSAK